MPVLALTGELVDWKLAEWIVGRLSYTCSLVGWLLLVLLLGGADGGRVALEHLFDVKRPTQNWHGLGESDCLIKTKHCDGC